MARNILTRLKSLARGTSCRVLPIYILSDRGRLVWNKVLQLRHRSPGGVRYRKRATSFGHRFPCHWLLSPSVSATYPCPGWIPSATSTSVGCRLEAGPTDRSETSSSLATYTLSRKKRRVNEWWCNREKANNGWTHHCRLFGTTSFTFHHVRRIIICLSNVRPQRCRKKVIHELRKG